MIHNCETCEVEISKDTGYYKLSDVGRISFYHHYLCSANCIALWLKKNKEFALLVDIIVRED